MVQTLQFLKHLLEEASGQPLDKGFQTLQYHPKTLEVPLVLLHLKRGKVAFVSSM